VLSLSHKHYNQTEGLSLCGVISFLTYQQPTPDLGAEGPQKMVRLPAETTRQQSTENMNSTDANADRDNRAECRFLGKASQA
jgi:hypothetical protein